MRLRRWRRWGVRALLGMAAVLLLIQVVPYGRDHANPAIDGILHSVGTATARAGG